MSVSGTPVLHDETMNDSAQITVFGNPPPSISCKVIACPLLKLFHQLTDTERRKFTKKDAIAGACSFCGMKAGVRENTGGVSALAEHFFENGYRRISRNRPLFTSTLQMARRVYTDWMRKGLRQL